MKKTHPKMPSNKRVNIPLRAMMTLLILTSMLLVTGGCKTVTHEISSDRTVITVHKGQPFTPPEDGKFVPTARWNELLEVYVRESYR